VGWFAGVVRWVQSGYIYHYALRDAAGRVVLMTYFVSWPMVQEWLKQVGNKNNEDGTLEPGHLDADRFRRHPAGPGARRPGARRALDRADRRHRQLPGDAAAVRPVRHRAPRRCSSSRRRPWIDRFNVNYHLGLDGISFWFVLLTAFITVVVVIAAGK
jgi:hypothetical protein